MIAKYRKWCLDTPNLPLFARDWWLDAVCGASNWNVVIDQNGLAIPYHQIRRWGLRRIVQPPCTQYTIVVDLSNHLSSLQDGQFPSPDVIRLISQMPAMLSLEINLPPGLGLGGVAENAPFEVKKRVTYRIPFGETKVEAGYSKNLKRNLKASRELYQVEESNDPELLNALIRKSIPDAGKEYYVNSVSVERMLKALLDRQCGRFLIAKEPK